MRRLTATAASLVMLLGVATYAAADCDQTITLVPSAAGAAIAAVGTARKRVRTREGLVNQSFEVEMGAVVPNGTTFMVFANGQPAGTITIALGVGLLDLNNEPPNVLPAWIGCARSARSSSPTARGRSSSAGASRHHRRGRLVRPRRQGGATGRAKALPAIHNNFEGSYYNA